MRDTEGHLDETGPAYVIVVVIHGRGVDNSAVAKKRLLAGVRDTALLLAQKNLIGLVFVPANVLDGDRGGLVRCG